MHLTALDEAKVPGTIAAPKLQGEKVQPTGENSGKNLHNGGGRVWIKKQARSPSQACRRLVQLHWQLSRLHLHSTSVDAASLKKSDPEMVMAAPPELGATLGMIALGKGVG